MDQSTLRPALGYFNLRQELPPVVPSWQLSEERLKRERETSLRDYAGSMLRQDGIIDGLIAHHVGSQMAPDANYNPFVDSEWKDLTEGVWEEYHQEFARAHSGAHARYIKDRLLEKQRDLTRLGDLGVPGNIGRIALGVLSPDNLVVALASGGTSALLRAANGARKVAQAGEVAGAIARAKQIEQTARAGSRVEAVAGGIVAGGLGNAAFEKVRQSVNFEDDSAALLEAGLIGAAFSSPFALAGARSHARVAAAAAQERRVLTALARADAGEELTSAELRLVEDVVRRHEVVREVEAGRLDPIDAARRLTAADEAWLADFSGNVRSRAEQVLDEMFPHRVTDRTRKVFLPDGQPLALPHDPTVRVSGSPIQVTPGGLAAPGVVTKADLEKAIREAAAKRFPKDPEKAERWAMERRAESLGYRSEVATKVAAAKAEKKAKRAAAKDPAVVLAGEPPKAPEKAPEPVKFDDSQDPDWPRRMGAEARKEGRGREVPPFLADDVERGGLFLKGWDEADEATRAAARPRIEVGRVVDFTHPRTGEVLWGEVEAIREDGWLMIRDEDGKLHPVHPSRLQDQPAPEGMVFGADSIGAARIANTQLGGGPATKTSRMNVEGKGVPLRWDIFATLNRSKSDEVKELAFSLVKDPLQTDAKEAQGMTASEWKSLLKRTVGGVFHKEARAAAREAADKLAVPLWKRAEFFHEFHSLVTRLTRGDLSVTMVHKDIAPMLQRASAAQRAVFQRMLKELKDAGVKGADQIDPNAFYVNRLWNPEGIRAAIDTHGEDAVVDLLATAINVPGLIGDRVKAKRFLDTVRRLEFSPAMQELHLLAQDMGTLRTELARAKLSDDDIDFIVDTMFAVKEKAGSDAGRAPQLKYRFDINETLSVNTPQGVLRIADLFENDARVLVDTYLNSMAGRVGLAKHGIYSDADFSARLRAVEDEALAKNVSVRDDVKLLQDVYWNIVGRPMSTQDFSRPARVAAALRGYSRAVNLGQLGLTAAFEMKQAVALMGFRAFWEQMPTFRQLITAVRNGYLPDDELARDLEHVVGFGHEMAAAYARAQEVDDGYMGQMLTRIERGANTVSHAVDLISGNASFTSITRQLASKMATQRLYDFALGLKQMDAGMRERLVGWGIDDDQIESMLDSLKRHTKADSRGKVEEIDWEAWLRDEPGWYHKFQTVNSRMVRDAIQDHDLGETIPFMHTTLGKVFGELKTFFLVAHAKNMLKNLSYRDATTVQVFLIAYLGEAMAYSVQAGMNNAHDSEKLEEALRPERIAGAAFFRSSANGMVPFFVEQGFQVLTGGESLVGPDMTANTGNRTFVPPALIALQRLAAAPSTAFGLLTGSDQVTQQEALNLWKTLPLSNLYGARNIGAWLVEGLPKNEPRDDD